MKHGLGVFSSTELTEVFSEAELTELTELLSQIDLTEITEIVRNLKFKIFRLRGPLNLLMCKDSSTDTNKMRLS